MLTLKDDKLDSKLEELSSEVNNLFDSKKDFLDKFTDALSFFKFRSEFDPIQYKLVELKNRRKELDSLSRSIFQNSSESTVLTSLLTAKSKALFRDVESLSALVNDIQSIINAS